MNKAYKTLTNPIERGVYLLELNGVSIDQEATSSKNPELLMLLIGYNDEISRIISPIAAKKMRKKLEGEIERLTKFVLID